MGHPITRAAFAAGLAAASIRPALANAGPGAPYYGGVLERYDRAGKFDGIALLALGNRIVYRGAAGLADRTTGRAHTIDETFRIASVTKQFTALMVMQEVVRGRLALDASIGTYLDGLPAPVAAITTRQLLKNVSGLPDLDATPGAYTRDDLPLDDLPRYVREATLMPLRSAPGSTFAYNNLDFLVVGAVLQKLQGMPFAASLRANVLEPLRLAQTGVYGAAVPATHVRGFEDDRGTLVPEKIGNPRNFGPAGAMFATLTDLARWDRALRRNELVGAAATGEMFTADKRFGYVALGSWSYEMIFGARRIRLVERQGNIGGIQVLNVFAPDDGITMIIVANTDFADLFNLYTKRGLPYELLALAASADARAVAVERQC